MAIRVLLADDHEMFTEGLKELLKKEKEIELVGTAYDGVNAVECAGEMTPDVVLMDMTMPRLNGIQATKKILKTLPETKILVLSMHNDKNLIIESLKAGARGYVLKECSSRELCQAIIAVYSGGYYFTPAVTEVLVFDYLRLLEGEDNSDDSPLTEREGDVMKLLVKGLSSKQIAARLDISKNTVDTHRRHIMEKLDCSSTAELIRCAIREGVIDLE